jgi:hypothetical protein
LQSLPSLLLAVRPESLHQKLLTLTLVPQHS